MQRGEKGSWVGMSNLPPLRARLRHLPPPPLQAQLCRRCLPQRRLQLQPCRRQQLCPAWPPCCPCLQLPAQLPAQLPVLQHRQLLRPQHRPLQHSPHPRSPLHRRQLSCLLPPVLHPFPRQLQRRATVRVPCRRSTLEEEAAATTRAVVRWQATESGAATSIKQELAVELPTGT